MQRYNNGEQEVKMVPWHACYVSSLFTMLFAVYKYDRTFMVQQATISHKTLQLAQFQKYTNWVTSNGNPYTLCERFNRVWLSNGSACSALLSEIYTPSLIHVN